MWEYWEYFHILIWVSRGLTCTEDISSRGPPNIAFMHIQSSSAKGQGFVTELQLGTLAQESLEDTEFHTFITKWEHVFSFLNIFTVAMLLW